MSRVRFPLSAPTYEYNMITERQEYAARLFEEYGTKAEVARQMGISESSVRRLLKNYDKNLEESEVPEIEYNVSQIPDPIYFDAPKKGVKRFILCAAQSQTKLHEPFWENLLAYKEYLGAELLVSTFNYVKEGFGVKGAKNSVQSGKNDAAYFEYYPAIRDFIVQQPVHIGDGLIFCAEMNTLPTAKNPLSGFEAYTKDKWGIFPHPKVHLKSVATAQDKPAKQIMTTAAITNPNYVIKRAGIEAHFHHQIGAVIVELSSDGSFWCRHLLARDDDGSFYDLDLYIKEKEVTHGHDVFAINWGDIHIEKIDPVVAEYSWGYLGGGHIEPGPWTLVNKLKPQMQFIHDLVDFSARNHHNINDPHFLYQTYLSGTNVVKDNLLDAVEFLNAISKTSPVINVVISNHDNALVKWLKNPQYDFRTDPVNAVFYLETQLEYYKALDNGTTRTFYEDTLNKLEPLADNINVIHEDSSFIRLGIEFGMHGHLGANGGKGSTRTFTKMGYKSNTGHTHTPEIFDGAYVAGTSSLLDMGYNKGLSSWSHSHIITYKNGARTIVTAGENGKFFADQ